MVNKFKAPRYVVGLGASAGGLEALERFFDHLPTDSGAAFVVVMHLSRDFKSMLDELLSRHTKMPVQPANAHTPLEADTVYVIQPTTTVRVNRTHIEVASRPEMDVTGPATSIDLLFHSIAKHWGKEGASIVLSGSGSDGRVGTEAVYKAGGFTCAQAPETAKFDSMPVSAIDTGKVKVVEAPDQLGETVIDGVILQSRTAEAPIPSDSDMALRQILDQVVDAADLDVSQYKHSTFERRVRRRMMDLDLDTLKQYADHISEDPEEAQALSSTLLINVTQFFRDEEAFSVISRQVVPEVIRMAQEEDRPIRMWVPGCATGQEAYTHAMLFAEALQDMPFRIELQIFASDVSREYLSRAGRGEYTNEEVQSVPENLRKRYFSKITGNGSREDHWVISKEIRKMIVFAPHDLLSDPPFTRLDVISCRNLLIYFSVEAQQRILNSFAFGLRERGFLFLGPSETVGAQRPAFDFIDTRNRIFRRTDIKRSALAMGATPDRNASSTRPVGRARTNAKMREAALQPAYAALLREFAPASLLISYEKELLHSFGDARRFLLPPEGIAHFDIADMVDPALKTSLIAGIERVFRDKKPITFTRISLEGSGEEDLTVDLTVHPLLRESDGNASHVLAIIDDSKYQVDDTVAPGGKAINIDIDQLTQERVEELEAELDRTREALQSTIEEIETTNEELQAANEELMSANEELQSTNEELSSVNEELYSVNAEYHRQNDELTRLSSDFDKLLHATEIGVVFLDPDAKITRFTSQAGRLFRLTDSDLNRPFSNYRSPFATLDPADLVERISESGEALEEETVDSDGQAWLVRAVTEEFHAGTILLLVNISRLRDAEQAAQAATAKLKAIRNASKAYFMELDSKGQMIVDHMGWAEFVGKEDTATPLAFEGEFVHPDDKAQMQEKVQELVANKDNSSQGFAHQRLWHAPSNDYRYVQVNYEKLPSGNWQLVGMDIDEVIRQKTALEERNAVLASTMEACKAILAYVGSDKIYRTANQAYKELMGRAGEDLAGLSVEEVMSQELHTIVDPYITRVLSGETIDTVLNVPIAGANISVALSLKPVADGEDNVIGYVVYGVPLDKYNEMSTRYLLQDKLIATASKQSQQAIITVDVESGRVEYANETGLRKLGVSSQNDLEDGVKVARITPELTDKSWSQKLAALDTNHETLDSGVIVFETTSSTTEADLITSAVQTEDGSTKAVIRIFENPQKVQLLDDLRSRSKELATSNRELEQFSSVIAHDLRAPLRHILQFAQIMQEDGGDKNNDEIQANIAIISKSANTMSKMVDGLLNYSRLGLGNTDFKPVALAEVVDHAIELAGQEIEEHDIAINIGELPTVAGDTGLLLQLAQNLIGNAIKYRKSDERLALEISAEPQNGKWKVIFQDTGIGISQQQKENIFALFKRLHSEKDYPGLGIGLAACRRIAEIHQGSIHLDDTFTNGARFIVTIPMMAPMVTEPADQAVSGPEGVEDAIA